VAVAGVLVSRSAVGTVSESTVGVTLGVGGFTPELAVGVGSGNAGSYSGKLARTYRVPMKMMRETATNRKTIAQARTARAVAVSCSSVNIARLCSR
jgi:hypothetical protein